MGDLEVNMFSGFYDASTRPSNVWDVLCPICPRTGFVLGQSFWEFEQFLSIVKELSPRTILEIGSDQGGSLFHLAEASAHRARVISIDPLNHSVRTEDWKKRLRSDIELFV